MLPCDVYFLVVVDFVDNGTAGSCWHPNHHFLSMKIVE